MGNVFKGTWSQWGHKGFFWPKDNLHGAVQSFREAEPATILLGSGSGIGIVWPGYFQLVIS